MIFLNKLLRWFRPSPSSTAYRPLDVVNDGKNVVVTFKGPRDGRTDDEVLELLRPTMDTLTAHLAKEGIPVQIESITILEYL